MPNKTTNFNLDLPTGDELFNPLWPNSNTTKIDAQMKKNMDNSVTKADCVFNTNKFIITREDKTGKIFKFIAPNDYVAGYTFTVDGTAMDGIVAGTGDALADGCFMNGHEVIAYIDEVTASLAFLVGSSLPDAIDATTLEGHGADYFATAAGLAATNQVATSAGQVANQALEAAQKAGLTKTILWENPNTKGNFTLNETVDLQNVPKNTKFIGVEFAGAEGTAVPYRSCTITPFRITDWMYTPFVESSYPIREGNASYPALYIVKYNVSNATWKGTAELSGFRLNQNQFQGWNKSIFNIFALS